MKTPLLLAFALLSSGLLHAQPVLTAADHMPALLDTAIRQYYQSSPALPGASGANVAWDFSQLVPIAHRDSAEAEPYPQSPITFHNWQLRQFSDVAVSYDYYRNDADSIAYAGHYDNGTTGIQAVYKDPELRLRFPMTYGDQLSDGYAGEYQVWNTPFATNAAFSGFSTSGADAYGSLLLPGGVSYTDVLRIHRQEFFTDSAGTRSFDAWEFYAPGQVFPVLGVASGSPFEASYVYVGETRKGNPPKAINELADFAILGSPVRDVLRIQVQHDGELELFGIDGKVHQQSHIKTGVIDIPAHTLAPGVYVARFTSAQGRSLQKFIHLAEH